MKPNPFSRDIKRFSVITPVYKDAYKTFPAFFSALHSQDYRHFEVIVVFDGPNKRGETALAREKAKYPNMKVRSVTQTWGGAPKARNTGARLAAGDYLTFIDPDLYPYPEMLRLWANIFENEPDKDVIGGLYDIKVDETRNMTIGSDIPRDASGQPLWWAMRFSNYFSGACPIRKEAFVGWDETVKSLQDWDMWIRMLKQDNFEGKRFTFLPRPVFLTEPPHPGGISDDSHKNWLERVKYVKEKNGLPTSDICVVSHGAPYHALNVAKLLNADYLPDPMYKPNNYKTIYLLGFYTAEKGTSQVTASHMGLFRDFKGKKLIHWIGTDVLQMHWNNNFQKIKALKEWFKEEKVTHLTEAPHTQAELQELGIKSKIVPLPPAKLYTPLPLPEQFTVGIYENATQQLYSEQLMQEVARSMPDVQFKFFGDETKKGQAYRNVEHLGWVGFDDWLPKLSCNVRITLHDGLPLTPLQFLTAGRNVVTNVKIPGSIYAKADRKAVIEAIRQAQATPLDPKVSAEWREKLDPKKFQEAIYELAR